MTKHTISYALLDDLEHVDGSPYHFEFEAEDIEEEVTRIVTDIFKSFENESISSPCYWKDLLSSNNVIRELMDKHYYVRNRYEKYYVVAFALDYKRFEVFSKDYDKELIKWRDEDENDEIIEQIKDPEYNMNPVVKLLRDLN